MGIIELGDVGFRGTAKRQVWSGQNAQPCAWSCPSMIGKYLHTLLTFSRGFYAMCATMLLLNHKSRSLYVRFTRLQNSSCTPSTSLPQYIRIGYSPNQYSGTHCSTVQE